MTNIQRLFPSYTFVRRNIHYVYVGPARRNELTNFTYAAAAGAIILPLAIQGLSEQPIVDLFSGTGLLMYTAYAVLSVSFVLLTRLYGFRLVIAKAAYLSVLPLLLFYYLWIEGRYAAFVQPWSDHVSHKLGVISCAITYAFSVADVVRNGGHDVIKKGAWEKVQDAPAAQPDNNQVAQ